MKALIILGITVWLISTISNKVNIQRHGKAINNLKRATTTAAAERKDMLKELQRQATQLEKHEEQMRKQEFLLQQATNDINNLAYRIEEAQEYSQFLENERSKCSVGSKEYFKWQNKLSANDDKIYRLTKQMNKAKYAKEEAERKIA